MPFWAISGLFQISNMSETKQKARNTNARMKKNHASGELGIKKPHAGLVLGI